MREIRKKQLRKAAMICRRNPFEIWVSYAFSKINLAALRRSSREMFRKMLRKW